MVGMYQNCIYNERFLLLSERRDEKFRKKKKNLFHTVPARGRFSEMCVHLCSLPFVPIFLLL